MQVDLKTILELAQYLRTGQQPNKLAQAILWQDAELAHTIAAETDSTDDVITIEEVDNMLNFIKLKAPEQAFGNKRKVTNWIKGQGFKGKWASEELQMKLEGNTWMWWS